MIRAYQVNNPHVFLGSFFSSSLIILISGALLVGFVWRMVLRARGDQEKDHLGSENRIGEFEKEEK